MGQLWNYIQHRPQIIVVGIFVLISFVSWVMRAIEAQRKRRQAALDRERAELDSLRTGQAQAPAPAPLQPRRPASASAQASLEEIAARRRAAMEQLQRRSAAPTPVPAKSQSAARREVARVLGQVLGVPGTGGPRPSPRPVAPRPVPRPPSPPPPARPAPRPAHRPNVESDRAYAVTIPKASQHTTGPGLSPGAPRAQGTPPRPAGRASPEAAAAYAVNIPKASQSTGPRAAIAPVARARGAFALSRADLKRSIVMREVLSAPVSLRDPDVVT